LERITKINNIEDLHNFKFTVIYQNYDLLENNSIEELINFLIDFYDIKENIFWEDICLFHIKEEDIEYFNKYSNVMFNFSRHFYIYNKHSNKITTI